MARTESPRSVRAEATASARPGSPSTQGTIWPYPAGRIPMRARPSRSSAAAVHARSRLSGSARARRSPWRAAAATTGLRPVEKTNDRARFHSHATSDGQPATKAPPAPKALPNVPTRASACTRVSAQRPRPSGPSTPSACASSTMRAAPCSSHVRRKATRSGVSASMLKYDSVTTNARPSMRVLQGAAHGVDVQVGDHRDARAREPCTVDDRSVVSRVAHHQIGRPGESGQQANVRRIAAGEDERSGLSDEVGDGVLQARVDGTVSRHQTGCAGA